MSFAWDLVVRADDGVPPDAIHLVNSRGQIVGKITGLKIELIAPGCVRCATNPVEGRRKLCAQCAKKSMEQSQRKYRARNVDKVRAWKRDQAARRRLRRAKLIPGPREEGS